MPRWLLLALTACGGTTAVISAAPDFGAPDSGGPDSPLPPSPEAGAPAVLTCTPDAGAASTNTPDDPSTPSEVHATNGTFIDSCTPAGDLTDYTCEAVAVCGPGPNPRCDAYETGRATPNAVDCAGHCINGACDGRCPTFNQVLRFVTVSPSGDAVLDNTIDGRRYTCSVSFDSPHDTFDCKTGPQPGMTATITSLGLHGSYCTGANFGGFGVKFANVANPDNESCTYACSVPR
jgi:hypothetical protein